MKGRPVYVRSVGAVTPLGETWRDTARALAQGRTAIGPVTSFDVSGYPCTVGAAMPSAAGEGEDRRLRLAQRAARQAWNALEMRVDPIRTGVFVGAESGRASFGTILALSRAGGGGRELDHVQFGEKARALAAQIDASVVSPAAVASALSGEFGARGPSQTFSLACSSSAAAIVEGARAIRAGRCDVALCGGVGADVDPLILAGFGLLGILSARGVSCPFDARRDGFVVGEGAAFVVLTSERAGAMAELAGFARSLDAHHLTAPDPLGNGAKRAMRSALEQAGNPQIEYVQAHGTSTPVNDPVEAGAIREVFATQPSLPLVSSVKGALGHWVAGAGALGFLCAIEAITSGIVLPTAGLHEAAADCDLPHVKGFAQSADVRAALVNAFAFGGANSSLVVRRLA